MTIKVIQWATGQLGAETLRQMLRNPDYEVVGVFVYSDAKDGVDAGTLVGLPPIGIKATKSRETICAITADLVIHAPQLQATMEEHDADVIRLLESGKNVISMMGYFDPHRESPAHAAKLEAACHKGNASLFGTGIDPGFVCERLATTISGLCVDIKHIHVLEAYDCSCATELMLRTMGFGMSAQDYHASSIGNMWDAFFGSTPGAVVGLMNGQVERVERNYEILLSDSDQVKSANLPLDIRAGTVAGMAWRWTAFVDGRAFFTLQTQWQAGKPIAGWETVSGWTISIDGVPSLRLQVQIAPRLEDILAHKPSAYNPELMAALVMNAAPAVIAAPAGLFSPPVFAPYRIPAH